MRRREFITLLGGAAAAWPLAARAQQPAMPVIGFLNQRRLTRTRSVMRAFRQGLKETGYVEGQNVTIEYRWAEDQNDRLPALAADLVRRRVAVIAATGGPPALAAKAATTTIPIVFVVGEDPVGLGSCRQPQPAGRQLTGVNFLPLSGGQAAGAAARAGAQSRSHCRARQSDQCANAETRLRDVQKRRRALGLQIQILNASTNREIDAAFATLARERPERSSSAAMPSSAAGASNCRLAARHAMPAIYAIREYVEAGGLMSYGPSITDRYRQLASMPGGFSRARSPPTCRSCSRPNSSSSSTSRPPRRSASRFRRAARPRRRGDRMMKRREFIALLGGAAAGPSRRARSSRRCR